MHTSKRCRVCIPVHEGRPRVLGVRERKLVQGGGVFDFFEEPEPAVDEAVVRVQVPEVGAAEAAEGVELGAVLAEERVGEGGADDYAAQRVPNEGKTRDRHHRLLYVTVDLGRLRV